MSIPGSEQTRKGNCAGLKRVGESHCTQGPGSAVPYKATGTRALAVVSQEVVDIELGSCAGDGRHLVEASMRPVPVVLVDPRGEVVESVGGVLVEPSVGPFSNSGLDKSLRLTVSAGSVDACTDVFDGEVSAGLCEE